MLIERIIGVGIWRLGGRTVDPVELKTRMRCENARTDAASVILNGGKHVHVFGLRRRREL